MKSTKNYFVNKFLLLLFYTDHVTRFTPFRLSEKLLCNYFLLFSGRVCKEYENRLKFKKCFSNKKGITSGSLTAKKKKNTRNEKANIRKAS